MTQIFISYSRKDLTFVKQLANDLRQVGFEVWYDLSGLEAGKNWGREIQAALHNSQVLIVVISPNSLESRWVEREYLFAEKLNLKIIPILYEVCEMPLWTLDLHYIDMTTSTYDKSLEDVRRVLGIPKKPQGEEKPEQAPFVTTQQTFPGEKESQPEPVPSEQIRKTVPSHKVDKPPPARKVKKRLIVGLGILGIAVASIFGLMKLFNLGLFMNPVNTPVSTDTQETTGIFMYNTPTSRPEPTATTQPTAIPYRWNQVNDGKSFPVDIINGIVVDPTSPGVIYVTTQNSGIYKTTDDGITWRSVNAGISRASAFGLWIDSTNPQTLYTGTDSGLFYKSTNGADSWQAVQPEDVGSGPDSTAFTIDPGDPQHLYYAFGGLLFESHDGAATWDQIDKGEACPGGIKALVAVSERELYAIGNCDEYDSFYTSRNSGRTWVQTTALRAFNQQGESFSPLILTDFHQDYKEIIYIRDEQRRIVFISTDKGVSWASSSERCEAMAVDPKGGLVALCDNGLIRTDDAGSTWQVVNANFGGGNTLAVSPQSSQMIYYGGAGFMLSTDGGLTWTERSSGLGAVRSDLILDTQSDTLYLTDLYELGYQSMDGGSSWEKIYEGGFNLAVGAEGELWRGTWETLLKSGDRGDTWDAIDLPQGVDRNLSFRVSASPMINGLVYLVFDNPGRIFVCSGGGVQCEEYSRQLPEEDWGDSLWDAYLYFGGQEVIYMASDTFVEYSEDGGRNWSLCNRGNNSNIQPSRGRYRLAVDPNDSNVVYLATYGRGVLRSTGHCSLWSPRSMGLDNLHVNTIAIDPNDPDILYAGTEGGAYVTFDGGSHWGVINNGLPANTAVYSIVVDRNSRVLASTSKGIFELVR